MKHLTLILSLAALAGCGEKEPQKADVSEHPPSVPEAVAVPSPPPEPPVTAIPTPPPATKQEPEMPARYTVVKGDTLYGIAKKHQLDFRELAEWNGIGNPDQIRPGQELSLVAPNR